MKQEKIWEYHQLQADAENGIFSGSTERYAYLAAQTGRGEQVLNIGVGRGGLERALQSNGCEVFSLDPVAGSIEHLRATLAMGERAQVGYSQALPFPDDSFDVVIMSEVLEHLTDEVRQASLQEVLRVLKSGARFIGTVPAEERLQDSLCVCPQCGETFHRWGHVQSFSEQTLKRCLSDGFQEPAVSRAYFSNPAGLNWKGRLERRLKQLLLWLGRTGTNESLCFSARKP